MDASLNNRNARETFAGKDNGTMNAFQSETAGIPKIATKQSSNSADQVSSRQDKHKDRSRIKATEITVPQATPRHNAPDTHTDKTTRQPRHNTGHTPRVVDLVDTHSSSKVVCNAVLSGGRGRSVPESGDQPTTGPVLVLGSAESETARSSSGFSDNNRSPSLSPSPKLRRSAHSPMSSPVPGRTPQMSPVPSFPSGVNRASPVSPHFSPNSYEQVSITPMSPAIPQRNPSSLNYTHGQMEISSHIHQDDHPSSHRDIFSPVPSERVPIDCVQDNQEPLGPSSTRGKKCVFLDSIAQFPAIKVETCDDSPRGKRKNAQDLNPVRKLVITPDNSDQSTRDEKASSPTSLNVPSPLIKRRTSDGRLIVGVNDDVALARAMSKMCSRSEGNIPYSLADETEMSGATLRPAFRASRSHSDNPLPTKSSRYSHGSHSGQTSNVAHKKELLSPSLPTPIVSKPRIRSSPEPSGAEIRKHTQSHSPQKRNLSPKN